MAKQKRGTPKPAPEVTKVAELDGAEMLPAQGESVVEAETVAHDVVPHETADEVVVEADIDDDGEVGVDIERLRNDFLYFVECVSPNKLLSAAAGATHLMDLYVLLKNVDSLPESDEADELKATIGAHGTGVLSPVMIDRFVGKSHRLSDEEWADLQKRVASYRHA